MSSLKAIMLAAAFTAFLYPPSYQIASAANAATAPRSATSHDVTGELIRAAGIDVYLAKLSAQTLEQITGEFGEKAGEDARGAQYLRMLMSTHFADYLLKRDVQGYISEHMSLEDHKSVLAWLNSDLGKRVTAIEIATVKPLHSSEELTLLRSDHYRMDLFREMDVLSESTISVIQRDEMLVNVSALMMIQMLPKTHPQHRVLREAINEALDEVSDTDIEARREKNILGSAVVYRELNNQDLLGYLQFLRSEESKRYHQVVRKAVNNALYEALMGFLNQIQALVDKALQKQSEKPGPTK